MFSSSSTTRTFFMRASLEFKNAHLPTFSISQVRRLSKLRFDSSRLPVFRQRVRELDDKNRAAPLSVPHLYPALVGLDDPVSDGQPETRPPRLGGVIGIEDIVYGLRGNAGTRIADLENRLPCFRQRVRPDRERAAVLHGFPGIPQDRESAV